MGTARADSLGERSALIVSASQLSCVMEAMGTATASVKLKGKDNYLVRELPADSRTVCSEVTRRRSR